MSCEIDEEPTADLPNRSAKLTTRSPADDPRLIASQALELAVAELERRLSPSASAEDEAMGDLDSAMAYLRRHTPPA